MKFAKPKAQTYLKSLVVAACLILPVTQAYSSDDTKGQDGTKIVPLFAKELVGLTDKEGMMLTVEYAPGASTPIHRHDAHVFVYVLEGSIIMQATGSPAVTLTAGQTFYENPGDVHAVSKNASDTKSAKFLVVLVKEKGAPPVLPAK